jgi:DNA-binding transcriptional MerR regulator
MDEEFLSTSVVAKKVGCHPNTVRLYEEWGYLPRIPRGSNNYRLFTNDHLDQMELAWTAFSGPYPGRTIKRSAYALVKTAANSDLGGALEMAYDHLALIRSEHVQAETAADLLDRWIHGKPADSTICPLRIGEAARLLNVTNDMLRNWENNGLIEVPRDPRNGYRQYSAKEIGRLRVIRMLVKAGYSMMAILRMLLVLGEDMVEDVRKVLDTPREDEDIYTAADQWLSTLKDHTVRANWIINHLERMIEKRTS